MACGAAALGAISAQARSGRTAVAEYSVPKLRTTSAGRTVAIRRPMTMNRTVAFGRNLSVSRSVNRNVVRSAPGRLPGAVGAISVAGRGSGGSRHGRSFNVIRGPRIGYRNGPRRLGGFRALAGFALGGYYYVPFGYRDLAAPACAGATGDGCQLRWMQAPTVDGYSERQCIEFCPQQ
jgi:hypothetical protein